MVFDHHNAYPFEMPKSLSPYACAAKTLTRNKMMLSSIEISYLKKMPKSLSPYACAVKTLAGHHASANRHRNAYPFEMPKIALALRLCSENARMKTDDAIKH